MKSFGRQLSRVLLHAAATAALITFTSCGTAPVIVLPDEDTRPVDAAGFRLLTRFVHLSDTHIIDEESPARLAVLGDLSASAWRPNEAYSTQILDGFVRTINQWHLARAPIDFVVVTGDALDNMQRNELRWFITCFDGGAIDPRSGPDDRPLEERPPTLLDPHQPFPAQGLYRRGVHGESESGGEGESSGEGADSFTITTWIVPAAPFESTQRARFFTHFTSISPAKT
jgi:hypothetical protein